ncbi:MAG: hypothetical protein AMXMBFR59_01680 [Rhodanobacteraceae bacterium]
MNLRWLAFVVMSFFALATAAACPPPLGKAQWEELAADDGEDPFNYASMRWLKCGWNAAEPAMRDLRAAVKAKARKDAAESGDGPDEHDEFVQRFVMILHLDPALLDEPDFFDMDEEPNPDDPAPLAELLRLRVSPATLASNFENGFPGMIALLRREPLSDADELMLELALVKQMARRGDIDAARARIDRLARDVQARQASSKESESDSDYGETELLQSMQAAFEPASAKSAAADGSPWMLDRSSHQRRFCGTGAYMARLFGSSALRESVLKAGDVDAAIGELLVQHWRGHLLGGAPQAPLLIELLRKSHGEAGLRQGWEDGIATLRDGESPAIHLFGHHLPLPNLVREDDSAIPGATSERALSREELVALVKASSLYRLSLGNTAFAD